MFIIKNLRKLSSGQNYSHGLAELCLNREHSHLIPLVVTYTICCLQQLKFLKNLC